MLDTKALAEATAIVVREVVDAAVSKATAPLRARIDELERCAPSLNAAAVRTIVDEAVALIKIPRPRDGEDGISVDPNEVRGWVTEAVAAMPPAEPGTSVTIDDVAPLIAAEVAKAVRAIPTPDLAPAVAAEVDRAVSAIPAPDLAPIIAAEVGKVAAAIRVPEDGKSLTVTDVEPLILAEVGKAVAALPKAQDGVGVAGALIDRTGALIVTLSNGQTCNLGRVEGEPGRDALGFDDLAVEHDGERGLTLRFVRGDQAKSFPLTIPVVIDRGVFKEGQSYATGDAVTFGGSLWIAQKDTGAKPDGPETGWRLAVKKGRDGRDLTKD